MRWQRLEAATRRIAADLQLARDEAVRTSTPRTVSFDLPGDKYTLVGVTDLDHHDQEYEVDLATTGYPVELLGAEFGGTTTLVFDVYGRPNNAGAVTVGSGGEQRTVTVTAAGNINLP